MKAKWETRRNIYNTCIWQSIYIFKDYNNMEFDTYTPCPLLRIQVYNERLKQTSKNGRNLPYFQHMFKLANILKTASGMVHKCVSTQK